VPLIGHLCEHFHQGIFTQGGWSTVSSEVFSGENNSKYGEEKRERGSIKEGEKVLTL